MARPSAVEWHRRALLTAPLIACYADRHGSCRVSVFGAAVVIRLGVPYFGSLDTGNTAAMVIATLVGLTTAEIVWHG